MTQKYIDAWGEEAIKTDRKDWSGWPVWSHWKDEFDWRDGKDFDAFDVIAWREEIFENRNARRPNKRKIWHSTGERLVIAEVRQSDVSSDWVYCVVVHCEGDAPFKRDEKIKRRPKNILRNGIKRWPREEEKERERAATAKADKAMASHPAMNSRFLDARSLEVSDFILKGDDSLSCSMAALERPRL